MNDREYRTGELLKRFIPYYKKHKAVMFMDLFCASLTTLCELVLPIIIRKITNTGLQDIAGLTVSLIGKMSLLYLVLKIIECLANYYMADAGHVMGAKIETDMRRDAYRHLQQLSNTYYNNTKVGQIMGRITNDLFDVTEFAHHCPEEFFIAGIKAVVAFIILATVNIPLTVMVFVTVPVMAVVCIKLNRRSRRAFAKQRVQIGELNASIEDSLLGQKVVKAFTNEDMECEKFEVGNLRFLDIKKETYKYMAAFQTSTRAFDGLMYLIVILAGGLFLNKGLITAGDLVAYTMYVSTLIATIRRIIEFAEQFQRGMTGIERFTELMDADIDIFDEEGAVALKDVEGAISFRKVSFEYPDDHTPVLSQIDLTIRPGEKVALVGPSGGGKTTLCNLIPRFYDPTEGEILIDGQNIRGVTLKSLRGNVGVVQQDVYLFSGSVYENIAYGRPGASREEVVEAAKLAGAHEFIEGLKDGYDTYVGERGVKLSGGQKQRISIARVFLKAPKVLLLDEATAALDNESEHLVSESLEKLAAGRTTLTIAHRLTTIHGADRILVLAGNRIVEEGNHEALMKKKGIYHQLYTSANLAGEVRG